MKRSKTKIYRGNSIFRMKNSWRPICSYGRYIQGQLQSTFYDKHALELCNLCIISTLCVTLLLDVNNDHWYFRETQPLPGKRQQHNSESAL